MGAYNKGFNNTADSYDTLCGAFVEGACDPKHPQYILTVTLILILDQSGCDTPPPSVVCLLTNPNLNLNLNQPQL